MNDSVTIRFVVFRVLTYSANVTANSWRKISSHILISRETLRDLITILRYLTGIKRLSPVIAAIIEQQMSL